MLILATGLYIGVLLVLPLAVVFAEALRDGVAAYLSSLRDPAAWAAIKLKSDAVWEIAVVTEAQYRGRGYAKRVVSAATAHILDHGRVPLYIHDRTNRASAHVCRSLGYRVYAETYFCEY